eukprot:m.71098 g.71098  ORF g.71098 m.71098 type:complete len:335 (-) comp12282_c0_seq4:149-1153(-)
MSESQLTTVVVESSFHDDVHSLEQASAQLLSQVTEAQYRTWCRHKALQPAVALQLSDLQAQGTYNNSNAWLLGSHRQEHAVDTVRDSLAQYQAAVSAKKKYDQQIRRLSQRIRAFQAKMAQQRTQRAQHATDIEERGSEGIDVQHDAASYEQALARTNALLHRIEQQLQRQRAIELAESANANPPQEGPDKNIELIPGDLGYMPTGQDNSHRLWVAANVLLFPLFGVYYGCLAVLRLLKSRHQLMPELLGLHLCDIEPVPFVYFLNPVTLVTFVALVPVVFVLAYVISFLTALFICLIVQDEDPQYVLLQALVFGWCTPCLMICCNIRGCLGCD